MPEPVQRGRRYMPGLDGLRAVAVLAVIAYHLGLGWAPGGLLGVGVFFTLSGYLITDLLLSQWATGERRLGRFWLARARRLLPALFVMLAVVVAWVAIFGPTQPSEFGDAVGAAVLYVSNWQQVIQDVSYFEQFGPESPLKHLWSLAVEEQFYIVWPFLLLLGTLLIRDPGTPSGLRPRLAGATLALALASAVAMAIVFSPSLDPSRVYYGTDTRACELLIGAALAMVWPSRRLRADLAVGPRRALDGLGIAGLAIIGLLVWRTTEFSPFLYRGGFVLLAAATALVVAALAHPASRLGPILGWEPLRWIGVRSYGIYLWHFPIIVLTTPEGVQGPDLLRDALQVAATFAVAALSWRYVEEPIRHGALVRLWGRLRAGGWRPRALPRQGRVALAGVLIVAVLIGAGLAGVGSTPGPSKVASSYAALTVRAPAPQADLRPEVTGPGSARQTSCKAVIHIGTSTSDGLISTNYLPNPRHRISARYADAGVTTQHYEISGARSIVETFEGRPNAEDVARKWRRDGYEGCWVLAIGDNDTANVFVGSNVGRPERIERMMAATGGQPTLWVNTKSLEHSGPYAAENMRKWNEALLAACPRHPNMRVFDWASLARDDWFIDDGLHYTTPGYAARAMMIARALAHAFPDRRTESSGCVVH